MGGVVREPNLEATVEATVERFALREAFAISRGSKREAVVVAVTLRRGEHVGRGECVPYARYGEEPSAVVERIRRFDGHALDREQLLLDEPPGAAREALDSALWDLEASETGVSVLDRVGQAPTAVATAWTLTIETPEELDPRTHVKSPGRGLVFKRKPGCGLPE